MRSVLSKALMFQLQIETYVAYLFRENYGMRLASALQPVQALSIHRPDSRKDFQQAEDFQRETWRYGDRDVVPASIFPVARNFGGQALGAFDSGRMVGFALSFGCVEGGHAHFQSHMVGVVPAYQNRGRGRLVKLTQGDDALSRGIDPIMRTYYPLQTQCLVYISLLGGYRRDLPSETLWQCQQPAACRHTDGSSARRVGSDESTCDSRAQWSAVRPSPTPLISASDRLATQTALRGHLLSMLPRRIRSDGVSLRRGRRNLQVGESYRHSIQSLRAFGRSDEN